jgi:hypothetical protein
MAITFSNGFRIGSTALYPFTSFTFTTVGVSGSLGPSGSVLLSAYTGSSSGSYFSNPQYFTTGSFRGYQIWTVPETATYEIEVAGARSGIATYPIGAPKTYWGGAIIRGRYQLTQGQKVVMVVGQHALTPSGVGNTFNGPGGGGGTYVTLSGSNTPIIVAGGAGSGGAWSGDSTGAIRSGSNGVTTNSGSTSWGGAPGGTGSFGGRSHINTASVVSLNGYDAGGGGGFNGNGFNGSGIVANTTNGSSGGGGLGFLSGSIGGVSSSSYPMQSTAGGFGGGGGGTPIAGGGGGGYSGGAGSYRNAGTAADGAGGGGSYIISTADTIATSDGNYNGLNTFNGNSITNLNSYNSGSGYIRITKL